MPSPSSVDVRSLLHEKLDAMLHDCDQVADAAAYGQTLNDLEEFFLLHGRQFIKDAYQLKLQERIEKNENTGQTRQCAQCKKNENH